jgi:hypothetical protein
MDNLLSGHSILIYMEEDFHLSLIIRIEFKASFPLEKDPPLAADSKRPVL